jgi:hypothetical protein
VDDARLSFQVEFIPDSDFVFMRAHSTNMRDGLPTAGAFSPHDGSLSADWQKYSSATDTRKRAKRNPPQNYAVLNIPVGKVRAIERASQEWLNVKHDPLDDNQAHSGINVPDEGADLTRVRLALMRIASVAISLESPVD